jgi:hypothetical protein
MKFTVTEFIKKYMKVGDDYQHVEVEKKYSVNNWDDLQNMLMSLIDFSDGPIKFEVRKEAVDEQ